MAREVKREKKVEFKYTEGAKIAGLIGRVKEGLRLCVGV